MVTTSKFKFMYYKNGKRVEFFTQKPEEVAGLISTLSVYIHCDKSEGQSVDVEHSSEITKLFKVEENVWEAHTVDGPKYRLTW